MQRHHGCVCVCMCLCMRVPVRMGVFVYASACVGVCCVCIKAILCYSGWCVRVRVHVWECVRGCISYIELISQTLYDYSWAPVSPFLGDMDKIQGVACSQIHLEVTGGPPAQRWEYRRLQFHIYTTWARDYSVFAMLERGWVAHRLYHVLLMFKH